MYETETHSVEETSMFLDKDNEGDPGNHNSQAYFIYRTGHYLTALWLSNAGLLCACIFLSMHILWTTPTSHTSDNRFQLADTYSPANHAVEYEYRQIFNDSRFLGPPQAEYENLMESILSGTLIRVSEEELMMHGSDSIPLKDGGYAAGLGVAHSLHCVRLIKRFIYREESYPDLRGDEFFHTQIHAGKSILGKFPAFRTLSNTATDHCLDYLRQSVMCQVDYTMYTLYWAENQQEVPAHHAPGPQKCVDWDKLHVWMKGRSTNTDMLTDPVI